MGAYRVVEGSGELQLKLRSTCDSIVLLGNQFIP
jgi:hypothetical protein